MKKACEQLSVEELAAVCRQTQYLSYQNKHSQVIGAVSHHLAAAVKDESLSTKLVGTRRPSSTGVPRTLNSTACSGSVEPEILWWEIGDN